MATYRKTKILPTGEYDAKVVAAEEKQSKSGNEMIVVKARVNLGDQVIHLRDYLLTSGAANWKFDSFQAAVGKQKCVDGQKVEPANYIGCLARVVVAVDSYKGEPQNKITKWLPRQEPALAQPSKPLPSAQTMFATKSNSLKESNEAAKR